MSDVSYPLQLYGCVSHKTQQRAGRLYGGRMEGVALVCGICQWLWCKYFSLRQVQTEEDTLPVNQEFRIVIRNCLSDLHKLPPHPFLMSSERKVNIYI